MSANHSPQTHLKRGDQVRARGWPTDRSATIADFEPEGGGWIAVLDDGSMHGLGALTKIDPKP